ncbi:MAG: hypothetical protein GY753_19105 [Gammaproteobacteria bacterium]|nr:hypothetical protein [Gammaproteobacteria bacterium]
MSLSDEQKTYIPRQEFISDDPQPEDLEYAQALEDLHDVINACPHAENVALFLSTCRNAYLTLNALFAEMSIVIGGSDSPSAIWKATDYLAKEKFSNARREFDDILRVLAQFEKKEKVWSIRTELWGEFNTSAQNVRSLKRDRVMRVIKKTKSRDVQTGYSWDRKLYEVDLREKAQLADRFADIRHVYALIRRAVRAGRRLCIYAANTSSPQQHMMFDDQVEKQSINWSDVVVAALEVIEDAGFVANETRSKEIRSVSRDGIGKELFALNTNQPPDTEELSTIATGLAVVVTEAVRGAYNTLCMSFKPNIATSPMPKPFLIDLTPYEIHGAETNLDFALEEIMLGSSQDVNKTAHIALAHFAVPEELYTSQFRFSEKINTEQHGETALRLIDLAKSKGAHAIVFPEYSLPRGKIDAIVEKANEQDIIVVGGLEGRWIEKGLANEAIIALPCTENPYFQMKQKPSGYEEEQYAFASDGSIKFFKNTALGDFAVVICSDYLEIDIQQTLLDSNHHPDFVLVPAYNPYPELFMHAAIADSARMYTNVVIANTCSKEGACTSDGSIAVAPTRNMEVMSGDFHALPGSDHYGVSVAELSIDAIACRHRPKPAPGYFNPPNAIKPKMQ